MFAVCHKNKMHGKRKSNPIRSDANS